MDELPLEYKDQTPKEREWTIRLIAAFKFLKGVILVIVAIKLLTFINQDVSQRATDFVTRHGFDLENKYIHGFIEKVSGIDNKKLMEMSFGSFFYASILLTEGIGLWLEKRWAEYFTVISTAVFIPLEIYEIFEKFTFVRLIIFILNILIVLYLINRLRNEKKVKRAESLGQNKL